MASKHAILLGGAQRNIGIVDRLRENGFTVVLVDYRTRPPIDADVVIRHDAKDVSVVDAIKNYGISSIDFVYTSMDDAGLAQYALCERYGLFCAGKEAICASHNKDIMHSIWSREGLLNRQSFSLTQLDLPRITQLNAEKKIIIKPSDACASRGISVLSAGSSNEQIVKAFELAVDSSSSTRCNIEEFVSGIEFSVEMCGDNYGNVGVYAIGRRHISAFANGNGVATKIHYNSTEMDATTITNIVQFSIRCYKALGLRSSMGHLEVILRDDGVLSPIEIGSRSSGFIASHLVDAVCGTKFLMELRNVQHGGKVQHGYHQQTDNSSMYYFYDIPPGTTAENITNITNYLPAGVTSLYHDRAQLKKGQVFNSLLNDDGRYGYEVLIGSQELLTMNTIRTAEAAFIEELSL